MIQQAISDKRHEFFSHQPETIYRENSLDQDKNIVRE